MWQSLVESLRGSAHEAEFSVVAVALDHAEAARPWIEAAAPSYPCLIDADHRVAELYHLVNVPQAVWIDEAGRIVRPPENAGSTDGFRAMDRHTAVMPAEAIAERARVKQRYVAAVKDWAEHGAASPHALGPQAATERLHVPDAAVAEAHARFRLGQALEREGRSAAARAQFDAATRLHPESWAMWRQSAAKAASGLAVGPEFWARVDALGDRPYHRPIEIAGITPLE